MTAKEPQKRNRELNWPHIEPDIDPDMEPDIEPETEPGLEPVEGFECESYD